jgi:hypothetical protein
MGKRSLCDALKVVTITSAVIIWSVTIWCRLLNMARVQIYYGSHHHSQSHEPQARRISFAVIGARRDSAALDSVLPDFKSSVTTLRKATNRRPGSVSALQLVCGRLHVALLDCRCSPYHRRAWTVRTAMQ